MTVVNNVGELYLLVYNITGAPYGVLPVVVGMHLQRLQVHLQLQERIPYG